MSLDHCVLPFEDESGLYGLLILTQFLHKSPSLRDTGMKCGVEPLISFFASTMSQHLGILLEQRIEMPHLGMELANLALSQAFFFRELARAMEHQSHGSRWPQVDRWCCMADFSPLVLHTTQTQEKPFNRHV